jgi:hypothetical protein
LFNGNTIMNGWSFIILWLFDICHFRWHLFRFIFFVSFVRLLTPRSLKILRFTKPTSYINSRSLLDFFSVAKKFCGKKKRFFCSLETLPADSPWLSIDVWSFKHATKKMSLFLYIHPQAHAFC